MRAGRPRAIGTGCAALAAAALCLGATSAQAADRSLEPDLVTLPLTQEDLFLDQSGKGERASVLRMTNEVGNQGVGPLEIEASGASSGCDGDTDPSNDRIAAQRVYEDAAPFDGEFDRETDTSYETSEIGCLQYHPAHFHWHVLDFAKYTLLSERTGVPTDGTKVGFCLGDSSHPFSSLGADDPYYQFSGCGTEDAAPSFMGISVGWADIYGYSTPGQRIRVTGLPEGRYCLRSEADPVDSLAELDELNNGTELRIHLNLERGRVRALSSACDLA